MSEKSEKLPPHEYQRFLQSLPADWERKKIRQLGTVVSGGTPSRDVPSFWRGAIPWVTPGELSGNTAKFLQDSSEHISATGLAGSGANLLPVGSLMVTTRATLGARAINAVPMATNQGFKSIIFKDRADAGFYFHLFEKVQPELMRRASGTTFLEISAAEFSCIEVPSPSSREKCLITKILDTLDTVIHETEAIIAKLKAVKQGLLHDLLTRGIDANGELRPPQSEAPHLYKQSPLGWIPKEWEQANLGAKVVFFGGYAFPERLQGRTEGEVPFFKVSDQSNPGNERELRVANNYVSRELARKQGWKLLPEGGVAFAKVGAALLMNRRRLLVQDSLVDNNIMVAVGGDGVHSTWLYWFLQTIDFGKLVQDGALPSVNQGQLGALPASFPKLEEQKEIADRLDRLDRTLDMEQVCLEKCRQLRSALMDDLLTGRVRVTPLLGEAEREKECA